MQTFDVGDKVKVVHWGKRFDLAQTTAKDMGLPDWIVSAPRDERAELVWTVVAKVPVGSTYTYGVTCKESKNSHIFSPEALEALDLVCSQNKFSIGDTVKVTNIGMRYNTYDDMASAMGLDLAAYHKHSSLPYFRNSDVFTIVSIRKHGLDKSVILCGIFCKETGAVFIINELGLEKVQEGNLDLLTGNIVRVRDWYKCYNVAEEMAVSFGIRDSWNKTYASVFPPGQIFKIVQKQKHITTGAVVYVIRPYSEGLGYIGMQCFMFDPAGLTPASKQLKPCGVQLRYEFKPKPSEVTHTFRLKFPNGEEIETPKPLENEWHLTLSCEHIWPARHIEDGPDAYSFDEAITHEEGRCWWYDFKRRAEVEKAQVLWVTTWKRIEQPKKELESYPQVYEWL